MNNLEVAKGNFFRSKKKKSEKYIERMEEKKILHKHRMCLCRKTILSKNVRFNEDFQGECS